jgi:hypothetical protein
MTNTTTVEKVRIPAEVAEAIEESRGRYGWPTAALLNRSEFIGDCGAIKRQTGAQVPIAKFIAESDENFVKYISAVINGYEIEKPPKKITLELTPEELGTIVASLNVVNDDDARDSARETNYEFSDNPLGVWQKLRDIYEQEARA